MSAHYRRSYSYNSADRLDLWIPEDLISVGLIWEFPKIGGTLLGVPIKGILVLWGLHWGPLISGNYHIEHRKGIQEWNNWKLA